MTIHFHSKHFIDTPLDILQYMVLLMFEQSEKCPAKTFCEALKISERSYYRIRGQLIDMGYLIRERNSFFVTDKAYKDSGEKIYSLVKQ